MQAGIVNGLEINPGVALSGPATSSDTPGDPETSHIEARSGSFWKIGNSLIPFDEKPSESLNFALLQISSRNIQIDLGTFSLSPEIKTSANLAERSAIPFRIPRARHSCLSCFRFPDFSSRQQRVVSHVPTSHVEMAGPNLLIRFGAPSSKCSFLRCIVWLLLTPDSTFGRAQWLA